MMRMTLTSPNVIREHRPDWLQLFNFFFLPLLSDLGGYPAGCDRSNFRFITRFESDTKNWDSLEGINILAYIFKWHPFAPQYVNLLRGNDPIISFMTLAEMRFGALEARWGTPQEEPA
jgi:hypothetical protein